VTERLHRLEQEVAALTETIRGLDAGQATCISRAQEILRRVSITGVSAAADEATHGGVHATADRIETATADYLAAADMILTIQKRCGSSTRPDVLIFKTSVDDLRHSAAAVRDLLLTVRHWSEIAAANELASEFQTIVAAEKRRAARLSYHDVTRLAIAVLTHDVDLRRHYKSRFSSIMIDEFQDNNEEQRQLLYLLAERSDVCRPGIPRAEDLDAGKLFFVGDEKQSIYRFRGADVSVFRTLSEDLGNSAAVISLVNNYRSEPGLIAFFNSFFDRIFDNPDPVYEARFSPLEAGRAEPGVAATVELWRVAETGDPANSLSHEDSEAYHVASFIRDSVRGGSLLVPSRTGSNQGPRPAGYSDFAILLRSTGNQMRFERMLRLLGVPYRSQNSNSLFLEAPLNDIYNVLQLVLYPRDRVALAAYLRSPLVGLSDPGLVRILASNAPPFGPVHGLSGEDDDRYRLAAARLEEISARADSERLTDLVYHIWYRWGYRYHLLRHTENAPYLEHFDHVYELARKHEDRGLVSFLRAIRDRSGPSTRPDELTVLGSEEPGVQIMTIHKSKGLEFPVVIVANTGNRGRTDSVSDAPFHWSRELGLVFNVAAGDAEPRQKPVNAVYRNERERALLEQRAELRRLLYVAATRAQAHLVFSGHLRGNDQSMMNMLSGPFSAAVAQLSGRHDVEVRERELEEVPVTAVSRHHRSPVRDMSSLAAAFEGQDAPAPHPRRVFSVTELNTAFHGLAGDQVSGQSATGRPAAGGLFIDTSNGRGLADVFGTYVHYCVQHLGTGYVAEAFLTDPSRLPGAVRPPLAGKNLERFLAEGLALANGFLQSGFWASIRPDAGAEFEVPFLLRLSPASAVRVRGKMDLVADSPDVATVVDFKTDRNLDPSHYVVQLHLYRRAAQSIFGKPSRSYLFDVRTGTEIPVSEEVSNEDLQRVVSAVRNA
jgi:ATP-dependent exoDNAse (exonuclease V) beta subunit